MTEGGMPVVCCTDAKLESTTKKPVTKKPVTQKPVTKIPVTSSKSTTVKPVTKKPAENANNYGTCGKSERTDERIVGGKNASLGK